jgi:hypothetical protein
VGECKDLNLVLTLGGKLEAGVKPFIGYCDADWGNSLDHGQSILGVALQYGQGTFLWRCRKQTATALSTGEAEFYAGTLGGPKVLGTRTLLSELGRTRDSATVLHIDSTSSICMIETPDQVSNHTKHININYHWIRDAVHAQIILPDYIPMDDNIADILTKPLPIQHHQLLVTLLGMHTHTDSG